MGISVRNQSSESTWTLGLHVCLHVRVILQLQVFSFPISLSLSRNELQGLAGIFSHCGGISAHQQSPACAMKQRGNSFCAPSSYVLSVCVCALLTLTNSLLHANLLLSLQFRLLPAFVCSQANCTMRTNLFFGPILATKLFPVCL